MLLQLQWCCRDRNNWCATQLLSSREISFPCCGAVWCAAERRLGTRPPGRKQMEIRADPVRCCHVNVPVRPQTAWSLCYSIFPSVGVYLFSGFPSPPEEWFVTATSWVHAWILSITHSRDALLNGKWGKRNGVELPLMVRCDPPNYTAAMCKRCEQPAAAAAPVPTRPIVSHGICLLLLPVAGSADLARSSQG